MKNPFEQSEKGSNPECRDPPQGITEGNPPLSAFRITPVSHPADGIFYFQKSEPGLPE